MRTTLSHATLSSAAAVLTATTTLLVTPPRARAATPQSATPAAGTTATADARRPGSFLPVSSSGFVPDTLEDLASHVTSGVVLIDTEAVSGSRQGSGFLVDPNGLILTNHHVIENARSIKVKVPSGDVYDHVKIMGVDQRRDIAVLQVPGFDLPSLPLGNSDSVRVGAPVIAVGSPLGLENTVSTGIVSGRRQEPEGFHVLQISAPASQGSSGGPVLSRRGDVIGIAVSQMRNGQNLNFAVPINYARGMLSHLDEEPVAVLGPGVSRSRETSTTMSTGNGSDAVNRSLGFNLQGFEGYRIEMEGQGGEDRWRRTRVTYRRIEAVGDRRARIERYSESEITERRGPFGTSQVVRRERSRTIVSADDLRPVSAQGETAWWTGDDWRQTEYSLRFDGYRAHGTITDTTGRKESLDRRLPPGILMREMRNLAFGSLVEDSLIGRSVEFVTFDPSTGRVTTDRYDVRDTTSVRVAGRSYSALEVNVATGLSNSTAYFRADRPRILLKTESDADDVSEEAREVELFTYPVRPDTAARNEGTPSGARDAPGVDAPR